ncbi:MAG: hypothetical protein R3D45_16275 [Rhizobiaceae bacterium]
MVQSILFLLLGFLSATLIALMIAPAIWRRAVALTRRRIEASVPLSLNELKAERDQDQAEYAMAIRRVEIRNKALNEKSVAQQADISRRIEDIRQLNQENDEQAEIIAGLESDLRELRADMEDQKGRNADLSAELASACDQIEVKIAEHDHVSRLLDEARIVSSNRQIDLVAREAQLEKLSEEMDAVKLQRDEAEAQMREMSADLNISDRGLQLRDKKISGLEKKLDRMVAALSDAEDRLDRREKELARFKEKLKQVTATETGLRQNLDATETKLAKLQVKFGTGRSEGAMDDEAMTELEAKVTQLEKDRAHLEDRLRKVVAENRRLKSGEEIRTKPGAPERGDEQRENAELRTQINHLAAELVNLTALLDGPNSEISRIIRDGKGANGSNGRAASIADRVRALREAALSAHHTGAE